MNTQKHMGTEIQMQTVKTLSKWLETIGITKKKDNNIVL